MLRLAFLMSTLYTLVVLQPSRPLCGRVCNYDRQYRNADCSEEGLRLVPASEGCQSARMMDLSFNEITSLNENDMLGYSDVNHLEMSNNAVSDLEPGAFNGGDSVIYIYLSSNQISELLNEGFAECNNTLQQLHLDRNSLTVIERGALKYLTRLTHLFLSHNELENLKSQIFQDLHSLESLYLNSNRLTSLPGDIFASLRRLQNLDLSNNDLLVLGDESFSPHCQLVTFVLAHNRLRNIPNPSSSCCLNGLQTLDVRSNNISDASNITQYISTTEKLFIDNNPFHCDCNLEDVRIWIQQEVTSRTSSELSCILPSSGESRLIRSLPDLCPTTTTTVTPPLTTSVSSHRTPREEDLRGVTLPTFARVISKTTMKVNVMTEVSAEDEKSSTNDLLVLVIVIPLSIFLGLFAGIVIFLLLVICFCQKNGKVSKRTQDILNSKHTPHAFKVVVRIAKDYRTPKTHENEYTHQKNNLSKDDTPHGRPEELGVNKKKVCYGNVQSAYNNKPSKSTSSENVQKASEIGGNRERSSYGKNVKETRPIKRRLEDQFQEVVHDNVTIEREKNGDFVVMVELSSNTRKSPTKKSGKGNPPSSPQNTQNISPSKLGSALNGKNAKKFENKIVRFLDENGEEKTPLMCRSGPEEKRGSDAVGITGELGCDPDGKDIERVNVVKSHDSDKENSLNESFQTKGLENSCQNEGNGMKVKQRFTPQKGRGRKVRILGESDRDNLNCTSSNC